MNQQIISLRLEIEMCFITYWSPLDYKVRSHHKNLIIIMWISQLFLIIFIIQVIWIDLSFWNNEDCFKRNL